MGIEINPRDSPMRQVLANIWKSLIVSCLNYKSTHKVDAAKPSVKLSQGFLCANCLPAELTTTSAASLNCSWTVLVSANLSCHPYAIVIHVFICLCTERDKKLGGKWVAGGMQGQGLQSNGTT